MHPAIIRRMLGPVHAGVGIAARIVAPAVALAVTVLATVLGMATVLGILCGSTAHAQDVNRVAALVAAASRYAQDYQQKLSAVVGEEHQTQRVIGADNRVRRQRDLVSDYLLVKVGSRVLGFRDVGSVDGHPIADRSDRLRRLFLTPGPSGLTEAEKITAESSRFNIGFPRTFDALAVPLTLLLPKWVDGFRFTAIDRGLAFDEVRSPSLIRLRDRDGTKDLPLRGELSIDGTTGRLLAAHLMADNAEFVTTVDIRYAEDAAIGLLVPVEATEQHRQSSKPRADRLEVVSTYGNFRRFQVTFTETFGGVPEK
jgi:hypothetical protein